MFDYKTHKKDIDEILSKDLFFIIGCPKSGTTWMENILNGHPQIRCSGETNFKLLERLLEETANTYNRDVISINEGIGQSKGYVLFSQDTLHYLFVSSMALLFSQWNGDSAVKCIGSKNPDIAKSIDLFAHLLPQAKFVHIIRDGRDATVSGWFHNLRSNPTFTKKTWPELSRYVEHSALEWSGIVKNARSFGQKHPDRYFELRYEDLHQSPDRNINRVLAFLSADASEEMVDLCLESGSFQRLAGGRDRGQENRNSFFRKGAVGDWKNHFDQRSIDTFMQYGGRLLEELGY